MIYMVGRVEKLSTQTKSNPRLKLKFQTNSTQPTKTNLKRWVRLG